MQNIKPKEFSSEKLNFCSWLFKVKSRGKQLQKNLLVKFEFAHWHNTGHTMSNVKTLYYNRVMFIGRNSKKR